MQKVAEQGDAIAQYNLGVMYNKGLGTEKDVVQAEHWFSQATEQEFALAQRTLRKVFPDSEGVKKNPIKKDDSEKYQAVTTDTSKKTYPLL